MMKKAKMAGMEASPSTSSYHVGREAARARFKYLSLVQDYEELIKETEAKKLKLHKAMQKKLKLMAEVKFLRKKYQSLTKTASKETPYRLKKQAHKVQSHSTRIAPLSKPAIRSESPPKDGNQRARETAVQSTAAVLDLNQVSLPTAEEMQEFQVEWEPLKVDKSKRCSIEGDALTNDLNLSICRDVGTGSGRVGKRKISWQDQVALKV